MESSSTVLWFGGAGSVHEGSPDVPCPHWGEGPFFGLWGNNASRSADRPLEKRPGSSLGKRMQLKPPGCLPFSCHHPVLTSTRGFHHAKQSRRIKTRLQPRNQLSTASHARLGKHGFQMVLHSVRSHVQVAGDVRRRVAGNHLAADVLFAGREVVRGEQHAHELLPGHRLDRNGHLAVVIPAHERTGGPTAPGRRVSVPGNRRRLRLALPRT